MHYYQFNIADYRKDTGHLDLLEHGIYRSLLDFYYLEERPIPLETQWVTRRFAVGYPSVETILKEFFEKREDGWHHLRCDLEIANYKHNSEKNRLNGKQGGRPKKTHSVILANPNETQVKGNQELNNQEPSKPKSTTLSGNPDDTPLPEAEAKPKINGKAAEAKEVLDFLNAKTGRQYRAVPANLGLIAARLREGVSVEDCRAVIAMKCREWAPDEKMSKYLRPATIFGAKLFNQYVGELSHD